MSGSHAFNAQEDRAWRALIRTSTLLPRHLNNDMMDARRVSLSEFGLLLHLSESEDSTLRMSDLADATGLSPSRVTRAVEGLRKRGWVQKTPDATDGRATTVTLTDTGRAQAAEAYTVQVADARRILFDHLSADDVGRLGEMLSNLAHLLRNEDRFE
jgi:DNA-binding MarR family transcriptional regulator